MNHFKGKQALEHVIEARRKGREASQEGHGTEMPGHYSAAADAAKETAVILLVLGTLFPDLAFLVLFLIAWTIWKVGRSAILGWARLERLHRVIEEERWEIEHHRPQEKEELTALYKAKGFSGKLLDEVVSVLMADDNRLLQVMLEEELGLSLESYEHPLKQAFGAFLGVLAAGFLLAFGFLLMPSWGLELSTCAVISLSAFFSACLEKNEPLPAIIWNLATAALALGVTLLIRPLL